MTTISILNTRLTEAIKILKPCIARRGYLSILQYVRLTACDGAVTLRATDMEHFASVTLAAELDGEVDVLIQASELFALAKVAGKAILHLDVDGLAVTASWQGCSSTLTAMAPGEFPEFPEVAATPAFVAGPALLAAARRGAYAVSEDATKPALSSVLIHLRPYAPSRVVSTDGFRMAFADLPIEVSEEARLVIRPEALAILPKGLEAGVGIAYDDVNVALSWPGVRIITRRVQGSYPSYEKVIPGHLEHSVKMNRKELLAALNTVRVKQDEYNKIMELIFGFPNLGVSFTHRDTGTAKAGLTFTGYAEPITFGFNLDYVRAVLMALDRETVLMEFNNNTGQVNFRDAQDASASCLIMPVMYARK